jgi:TolA-binding protein
MLVNILIVFFLFLIIHQFYKCLAYKEGLENASGAYQNYPDDPLILARINAGNIEVLKTEVVQISDMKTRINNLEEEVKLLNEQMEGLNQQNTDAVNSFSSASNALTSEDGGEGETPVVEGETNSGEEEKKEETTGENSINSYF